MAQETKKLLVDTKKHLVQAMFNISALGGAAARLQLKIQELIGTVDAMIGVAPEVTYYEELSSSPTSKYRGADIRKLNTETDNKK